MKSFLLTHLALALLVFACSAKKTEQQNTQKELKKVSKKMLVNQGKFLSKARGCNNPDPKAICYDMIEFRNDTMANFMVEGDMMFYEKYILKNDTITITSGFPLQFKILDKDTLLNLKSNLKWIKEKKQ